jgi:hypothetical protein
MYDVMIALHSVLRWVVLLLGLLAVGRGIAGWSGRSWTPSDNRAGVLFVGVLDLQLLIGLILYLFLSPTVRAATVNIGAAMGDSVLRFFLVEHAFGMLLAVTLAHIGRIRIRKAAEDRRRHRAAAIYFGIALVLVLLSIPWPGMPAARPLWPW